MRRNWFWNLPVAGLDILSPALRNEMAIVIEAFTVIVRNSTLDAKYPGGRQAFAAECPNGTYCHDGTLSGVSFMHSDDAHAYVAALVKKGLIPIVEDRAVDAAVVSVSHGLQARGCEWLLFATYRGVPIAWADGTPPTPIVASAGYEFGRTSQYVSAEEARENLVFLRSESGFDVYRDKRTGKEQYVARAQEEE
jgi:hypothetical protein